MIEQQLNGCLDGCDVLLERNRYFTGKSMTARDFRADPDYLLSRHRLHNRLLHGWGLVCGLTVRRHDRRECRDWVIVDSGIALDCCGRELVVECEVAFRVRAESDDDCEEGDRRRKVLCLRYGECEAEPVPVLLHEAGCTSAAEANRVREVPRLELRDLDELADECWPRHRHGERPECKDDCVGGPARGCVEPSCPCGECVPLALLTYEGRHPERGIDIDLSGRRHVHGAGEHLTRIAGISWPHGGSLSLRDLERAEGRLRVWFSRPLRPRDRDATGINPFTFIVQYGGIQRTLEFLPGEGETPRLCHDDPCAAEFRIDPRYLAHRHQHENIAGTTVFVTLRCDFILDCHGTPVSGKHLGGRRPTGDGTPGGLFESWFHVT